MSRELKSVVLVDGVAYGPGYETAVPEHVAKRITNPAAWGEDVDSDEGHGIPGDLDQQAAGLLPHTPLQPNQITPGEPAGPGGLNPFFPPEDDTVSSAVPAGVETPSGMGQPIEPLDELGGALHPEPPRSGRGATEAAWRAFAGQHGVNTDGLDRSEIIAKLKDDGVIQ